MNPDATIRSFLGAILVTLVAVEIYYLMRMRSTKPARDQKIRDNRITASLPATLIDLGLILAILYVVRPGWMGWSRFILPMWIRWTGVSLALAGFALRFWTHIALGSQYTWYMRIQRFPRLVTNGPYRHVRHPMYTASLLLTIGISLAAANWFIGLLLIAPALITLAWRLDREEAMLLETFGDDYRAYQRRTGRLLPRW